MRTKNLSFFVSFLEKETHKQNVKTGNRTSPLESKNRFAKRVHAKVLQKIRLKIFLGESKIISLASEA